jgi:hypothetical protein
MVECPPQAEKPDDCVEWLQRPTRILVRRHARLGHWYYVLRPLAIVYAILFRALREILAVLLWVAWCLFWLVAQVVAWSLGLPIWILFTYTRLRHGKVAAAELRRVAAESEAAGAAWQKRASARLARRVGWPSNSPDRPH